MSNSSSSSNDLMFSTRKRVTDLLDNAPQQIDGVTANIDQAIHGNEKALQNLCKNDLNGLPNILCFKTYQIYINQYQRDIEVRWLLEICDKFQCDSVVFPLATSYFDRYLCAKTVEFHELRFISSACFFLAAKMKMAKPPKYEMIQVDFPHITTKKLFDYELQVSQAINWQFCIPTPYEFYDHFIAFSKYFIMLQDSFTLAIRDIYCDFDLSCIDPQLLALGALYYCITNDTNFTDCVPSWFDYFQKFRYPFQSLKKIYDQLYIKQQSSFSFLEYTLPELTYTSSYLSTDYNPFSYGLWCDDDNGNSVCTTTRVPSVLF